MTNKNPYENQNDTIDIPDFVEDKTATESSTVDMNIFKMSDEELYDDVEEKTEDNDYEYVEVDENGEQLTRTKKNRGKRGGSILSLVLNFLLLAALAAAIFYALSQHKAYVKANTDYQQVLANQETYKQQIASKDAEIEALNKQIEDLKKAQSAGGKYTVVDGPISFRKEPSREAAETTFNGNEYAQNDDTFDVIEIVKGQDDSSYKWAKVADDVYFCIGTSDDVWAKKVD